MKKTVIILATITTMFAQMHNIYGEAFGPGLLGSINYERMLIEDKNIFLRAGYGGFTVESTLPGAYDVETGTYVDLTSSLSINPIILGVTKLWGNKWRLEAGGGVSLWMVTIEGSASNSVGSIDVTEDGMIPSLYTTLGVRYQNPEGGLNLKLGLSPTILFGDLSGTIPFPHLSLGYSF